MLELAFPVYDQDLIYAQKLVADLSEDQITKQPVAGQAMNHPALTIGHLAYTNNFAATLLGHPMECPAEWKELLGNSAKPQADRSLYPSKAVLLSALESAHSRLKAAIVSAKPEQLAEPAPERMRNRYPTVEHVLLFLLTAHEAVHLGQLSAWRRASGLPPV